MKKKSILGIIIFTAGLFFTLSIAKATDDKFFYDQDWLDGIGWSEYIKSISKGANVVVAVIDEGVWQEHPDLQGNIWVNTKEIPQNEKDDDGNGYIDDYYGWNFVDNNSDMATKGPHGTNVAGIIVASHNFIGIAGIAPESKIMSLIACNKYSCDAEAIKKAIRYATDNGANIINLSLGADGYVGYTTVFDSAIRYAYEKNVVIVVSAGNGDTESAGKINQIGQNLDFIKASPVSNDVDGINMVVGVGASKNGSPLPWSNYGSKVDVWAPGSDVLTTTVPVHVGGYGYEEVSGTSFSSPMVAGTAALVKSTYPNLKNWEIVDWLKFNSNLDINKIFKTSRPSCSINKFIPNQINADESVVLQGENIVSTFRPRLIKNSDPIHQKDLSKNFKFLDATKIQLDTSGLNLSSGYYSLINDSGTQTCKIGYANLQILDNKYDNDSLAVPVTLTAPVQSSQQGAPNSSITLNEAAIDPNLIRDPKRLDEILSVLGLSRNEDEETKYRPLIESDATAFKIPLTADQKDAVINFIVYGISKKTILLGTGERRALVRDYFETVGRGEVNWEDIERLVNGQKVIGRNLSKEHAQVTIVLKVFKRIFGHDPVFSDTKEDLTWNTMMYRIRFQRDLDKEKVGITKFKQIFKYTPRSPLDWATVRALGYVN